MLQNIVRRVVKKEGQKANYSGLDAMLSYSSGKRYPRAKSPAKTDEEEEPPPSGLEEELKTAEIQPGDGDDFIADFIPVRYLCLEEALQDSSYQDSYEEVASGSIYQSLGPNLYPYYEEIQKKNFPASKSSWDAEEDLSFTEEVVESLDESKYGFLANSVDVDFEQQEKTAIWILFNQGLFTLLEYIHHWNREINYQSAA